MTNFDWASTPTFFDDVERQRLLAEAVSFAQRALIDSEILELIRRGFTDADVADEMARREVAVTADQVAEVRRNQ